jgi:hypothetical protein
MAKAIAVPNIAKPESCLYGLMTTQHPRQSPGSAASLVLLLVPIPPGVIRLYWAAQAATLTNGCTADDRDEYPAWCRKFAGLWNVEPAQDFPRQPAELPHVDDEFHCLLGPTAGGPVRPGCRARRALRLFGTWGSNVHAATRARKRGSAPADTERLLSMPQRCLGSGSGTTPCRGS